MPTHTHEGRGEELCTISHGEGGGICNITCGGRASGGGGDRTSRGVGGELSMVIAPCGCVCAYR